MVHLAQAVQMVQAVHQQLLVLLAHLERMVLLVLLEQMAQAAHLVQAVLLELQQLLVAAVLRVRMVLLEQAVQQVHLAQAEQMAAAVRLEQVVNLVAQSPTFQLAELKMA
jgi:hypothetical protein